MAIRQRPDQKRQWQVYWNNPHSGKRESMSFATRAEAEKEESLVKHRLKFERDSFKPEEQEEEQPVLTLEMVTLEYIKARCKTRQAVKSTVHDLRQAMRLFGSTPIAEIDPSHFDAIDKAMIASGNRDSTRRLRLSRLQGIIRFAVDKGWRQELGKIAKPQARYRHFVPPTPAEIAKLLAVASPLWQRVIIVGTQTGCRVGPSEMLRLTWDMVDFDRAIIRIPCAAKNKNLEWREVPLRQDTLDIFRNWHDTDKTKGIEQIVHGKSGSTATLSQNLWTQLLAKAGVRRFRMYDLRHAFATDLIAAGADVGTVAQLMGHSSPMMVLTHYQHVTTQQKRAAIDSLPSMSKCDAIHVTEFLPSPPKPQTIELQVIAALQ